MPGQHSGEFLYQNSKLNVSYLTLKIGGVFVGGPGICPLNLLNVITALELNLASEAQKILKPFLRY